MGFISEFKTFAMRGNVLDMAVGIIIGGAFGKIVASLVSDIIMPPIGLLLNGVDFSELKIVIKHATDTAPAVAINYGLFVDTIIQFLIVALSIFVMIKAINKFQTKKEAAPAAPPAPTEDQKLLGEIRDILKNQSKK